MLVHPNLYEFLKLMNEESHSCWIFIDALCINQDDSLERHSQVELMGAVYTNAEEVVAWLGIEDPSTDVIESQNDLLQLEDSIEQSYPREVEDLIRAFEGAFLPYGYWSRLWIVQEIMPARILTFRFRRIYASVALMEKVLDRLKPHLEFSLRTSAGVLNSSHREISEGLPLHDADRESETFDAGNLAYRFLVERKKFHANDEDIQPMALSRAIRLISGQACSLRYDKIYGLLGLTQSKLMPSYAEPLSRLYQWLMAECLWEVGRQRMLDHREFDEEFFVDQVSMCEAIISALDIDIWHPTVFLVTQRAFDVVESFTGKSGWNVDDIVTKICMNTLGSNSSWTQRLYKARAKLTLIQLKWFKFSRYRMRPMGSPDSDIGGTTYIDWIAWTDNQFFNLLGGWPRLGANGELMVRSEEPDRLRSHFERLTHRRPQVEQNVNAEEEVVAS